MPAFLSRRPDLLALAILLMLPLLAHLPELAGWVTDNPIFYNDAITVRTHPPIFGGQSAADGNVGNTLQALGGLAANLWLHGTIPWWNPYAGAGLPLAAEMQPAALFLPFVLLLHFLDGVLYLKITLQMIAGFFTYLCLREMRQPRAAAVTGALLYQLNGTFAWYGDAPTFPGAFLPLMIFAIERSRNAALAGKAGGPFPLAVAMGWSLLAGFPETAFMDGLLGLAWAILALVRLPPAFRWPFIGKIATGGLAGVALAAPAVIPFLHYLANASLGPHRTPLLHQLGFGQSLTLLLPSVFGPPFADFSFGAGETGGYLTTAADLLALTALVRRRNKPWCWLAAAWCAFWLSASLGEPVTRAIWSVIPGLNLVDISRYAMPTIEFCVAMLAAEAVAAWCNNSQQFLPVRKAAVLVMALIALSLADAVWVGRFGPSPGGLIALLANNFFLRVAVIVATVTLLALVWLLRGPATGPRTSALAGVVAMEALAAFIVPTLAGAVAPSLDLAPITFLCEHAGFARTYVMRTAMSSNYGAYFGVSILNSGMSPLARAWAEYLPRLDRRADDMQVGFTRLEDTPPSGARMLQLHRTDFEQAGVRYVLVRADHDTIAPLGDPYFHLVFANPRTRIYELPGAMPYFTMSGGPCEIDIKSRERVSMECAKPAQLVRREMMFPGWSAQVNGHTAPIAKVQDIFQQIDVPAGHSRIVFSYRPPYANLALILFLVGGITIAGAAIRKQFFFEKKNQKTFDY